MINKFLVQQIAETIDDKILLSLDIELDSFGNYKGCCPVHGGDNPRAFSYSGAQKTWQCFTHRCHLKHGGNLIGLVMSCKHLTFIEALKYIIAVSGEKIDDINPHDLERKIFINSKKQRVQKVVEEKLFPITLLDSTNKNKDYFKSRGFGDKILEGHKVFLCDTANKELYGRACIPLLNEEGQLYGIAGRATDLIQTDAKWFYYPKEIQLPNHFFGEFEAKAHCVKNGYAILVEGPLDVIRMHEAGFMEAISPFANYISDKQLKKLLGWGIRTVIIAFDPDDGGDVGSTIIKNKGRLYFNIIDIHSILPDDPGDMSVSDIEKVFTPICQKLKS